jgi:hypothetical protein
MGTSSSKGGGWFSSGASVAVSTNKSQFMPGESGQARAHLNFQKPIQVSKIYALIQGNEDVCVQYTQTHTRDTTDSDGNRTTESYTTTEYDTRNKKIFSQQVPLAEFVQGQTLMPGGLDYIVNFALPKDIPSSFSICRGSDRASICYSVSIHLQRPGIFTADKVSSVMIDVVSPPTRPPMSTMIQNDQEVVACCFDRGSVSLGAMIGTNQAIPGDEIMCTYQVNNRSTRALELSVELRQSVQIRAYSHSTTIAFPLVSEWVGGVSAGRPGTFVNSKTFNGSNSNGQAAVQLRVPAGSLPSVAGMLVTSEHAVVVTGMTDACCTTNPSVRLPVDITSIPAPLQTLVMVFVPPGAKYGMPLPVTTPAGQQVMVNVPRGCAPGQCFMVSVRDDAPSAPVLLPVAQQPYHSKAAELPMALPIADDVPYATASLAGGTGVAGGLGAEGAAVVAQPVPVGGAVASPLVAASSGGVASGATLAAPLLDSKERAAV